MIKHKHLIVEQCSNPQVWSKILLGGSSSLIHDMITGNNGVLMQNIVIWKATGV